MNREQINPNILPEPRCVRTSQLYRTFFEGPICGVEKSVRQEVFYLLCMAVQNGGVSRRAGSEAALTELENCKREKQMPRYIDGEMAEYILEWYNVSTESNTGMEDFLFDYETKKKVIAKMMDDVNWFGFLRSEGRRDIPLATINANEIIAMTERGEGNLGDGDQFKFVVRGMSANHAEKATFQQLLEYDILETKSRQISLEGALGLEGSLTDGVKKCLRVGNKICDVAPRRAGYFLDFPSASVSIIKEGCQAYEYPLSTPVDIMQLVRHLVAQRRTGNNLLDDFKAISFVRGYVGRFYEKYAGGFDKYLFRYLDERIEDFIVLNVGLENKMEVLGEVFSSNEMREWKDIYRKFHPIPGRLFVREYDEITQMEGVGNMKIIRITALSMFLSDRKFGSRISTEAASILNRLAGELNTAMSFLEPIDLVGKLPLIVSLVVRLGMDSSFSRIFFAKMEYEIGRIRLKASHFARGKELLSQNLNESAEMLSVQQKELYVKILKDILTKLGEGIVVG